MKHLYIVMTAIEMAITVRFIIEVSHKTKVEYSD